MRIAVYHHLPSGGALYHLHQVVTALKDQGHWVKLFTPSTAENDFLNLSQIVDDHHIFQNALWTPNKSFLNPIFYKKYLKDCIYNERGWAKIISSENLDGIYLGQCRTWTEPPLLKFLPKALPKVLYCQEPKRTFHEKRFLKERERWPWHKKLWRQPTIHWMMKEMEANINQAHLVLCNSNFSKEKIQKAYPNLSPEVSYIGVDQHTFTPRTEDPKKLQLLSVGALDPSKNHHFAIEVAALRPGKQNFKVVIVGDRSYGNTAEELRSLAHKHQIELEIRTRLSTENLVQTYRESFATIYTPLEEPFGIVSIESQACGTPVLGADEGGIKETLLDGIGGFRLPRQPEKFSAILADWISNPAKRRAYSLSAREHILNHWTKEKLIKNTCKKIIDTFVT
jgi:glycosyltransferase involved in cell wall biosynthesis